VHDGFYSPVFDLALGALSLLISFAVAVLSSKQPAHVFLFSVSGVFQLGAVLTTPFGLNIVCP
jgi:hypothetical protein